MRMFEKVITGRRKRLAVSLALLLLLATVVAVSHYHANTSYDHDCPVCIASNHHSSAGPSTIVFDGVPYVTETTIAASAPALRDDFFFSTRDTRGPPA